jgi:glutathione S-transferase
VLDGALEGRDHLVSDQFNVADLNVASVLSWGMLAGLDFSAVPNVKRWLVACTGRTAAKAAMKS